MSPACGCGFCRIGEASNPGPDVLWVSSSNPSGLRGKEALCSELQPGIHCFAETQLSGVTLPAARRGLQAAARAQHRCVRVLTGADAPLRSNSLWAGSWTGVLQASDFPSRVLQLNWPPDLYATGRVLCAQHYVAGHTVTVQTVYGYPMGPTWPDARQRTNAMLSHVTRELVLGSHGIRLIVGDFNHSLAQLSETDIWRQHGWAEAQEVAQLWWAQEPQATCKGTTVRDFVWLSPEALTVLSRVHVTEIFQEHSTVIAELALSSDTVSRQSWPLPHSIPWCDVRVDSWHAVGDHAPVNSANSTEWFAKFSHAVERSLQGHVSDAPGSRLPAKCFGRGRRLRPVTRQVNIPPKPSRPGEEQLAHDGLGAEVIRWFKQLRRLQSLLHSLKAGRDAPAVLDYQLSLWQAILSAKGFQGGFMIWWRSRATKLAGSPHHLPHLLPGLELAEALFLDFRVNFRNFERWHLAQRGKLLAERYDNSKKQLYLDLRDPAPPQVDVLSLHHCHAILAVEPDGCTVQLDSAPDQRGANHWTLDGAQAQPLFSDGAICTLSANDCPAVDQELEQVQTLHSTSDVRSEFVSLWSARWQRHRDTSLDCWTRVLGFASAFLPRLSFDLPDITEDVWYAAVRRFKPKAARGPDGWARDDLLNLPPARTRQLLSLLEHIEAGAAAWPAQLLHGFVILLSKQNGRTDAQAFRPICLYSVIFRAWSGIRARQLLQQLRQSISHEMFGFLPGHEAAELWYTVQVQVELCCQGSGDLHGLSTDLVKAFNQLPRQPLLCVASHVGFPGRVLTPWAAFLAGTVRRITVHDSVSQAIPSSCGFPEGDPLSPVAMVLADWIYHRYLQVYAPSVRSLSYVDNLAFTANAVGQLIQGYNLTQCFGSLLDLELDAFKTFVWSTCSTGRRVLTGLGLTVQTQARELGGVLSYGSATRNALLAQRCSSLTPLWQKLRRSRAPLALKRAVLPSKFWARALHGSPACPLGAAHLGRLRSAATKALSICPAGSNSLLRLSLAANMEADPGFYELWHSVMLLRRLLFKVPSLLSEWQLFMSRYDGQSLHGPFTKLVQLLSAVGWMVLRPPFLQDAEGLTHNLLECPVALLRRLLEQAWLDFVSAQVRHRQTMCDLDGLDVALLSADASQHTPLDLARLCAIRSGAFLFGAQHAKYDLSQSGLCVMCHEPDTVEHRVCHCPCFASQRRQHIWVCQEWPSLPVSLRHHLLPARNPHLAQLRAELHALPDHTAVFYSGPTTRSVQHLFTDGACDHSCHADFALAAWGVTLGDVGLVVSGGFLPGLHQTAPRAELTAMISAARWALQHRCDTVVWADAKNVVDGVWTLQAGDTSLPDDNHDLWKRLAALLEQLPVPTFRVQHTPSHLDSQLTESPFEDWLAAWNNHVDLVASLVNHQRPTRLAELHKQALVHHHGTLARIRAIRSIFFNIAAAPHVAEDTQLPDEEHDAHIEQLPLEPVTKVVDLEEVLVVGWPALAAQAVKCMPTDFVQAVCGFLISQDALSEQAYRVSWLEVVFLLEVSLGLRYPVTGSNGVLVSADSVVFRPTPPTVASRLQFVRRTARPALKALGLAGLLVHGLDRTSLGVCFRLDGLICGFDPGLLSRARLQLACFCAARHVGSVAALARPL